MGFAIKDRWLVAENIDGSRQYIIHTDRPRFIAEIFDNDNGGNDIGEFEFIDDPFEFYSSLTKDDMAAACAKLARQAGDALNQYDINLGSGGHNDDED